jgi:hypothetical protein
MILDNLVGIARRCELACRVVAAVRAHFSTGKTSPFILGKIKDDFMSFLQDISVMVTADFWGGPPRLLGEEGGYQSSYSSFPSASSFFNIIFPASFFLRENCQGCDVQGEVVPYFPVLVTVSSSGSFGNRPSIPSASSFFDIIFPASFFLSENRQGFDVQGEVVPYFSALVTVSSLGSFGNRREKRGLFQTSSSPFISNVRFSGNYSIFSSDSPGHLSFLFTVSSFGNSGNLLLDLETASLGRHGEKKLITKRRAPINY